MVLKHHVVIKKHPPRPPKKNQKRRLVVTGQCLHRRQADRLHLCTWITGGVRQDLVSWWVKRISAEIGWYWLSLYPKLESVLKIAVNRIAFRRSMRSFWRIWSKSQLFRMRRYLSGGLALGFASLFTMSLLHQPLETNWTCSTSKRRYRFTYLKKRMVNNFKLQFYITKFLQLEIIHIFM